MHILNEKTNRKQKLECVYLENGGTHVYKENYTMFGCK